MRLFGVDEAQKFVPHLLETFGRVRGWLDEARIFSMQLEKGPSKPERARLEAEISARATLIRDDLARLEEAGIELKAVDGLVDFRSMYQGRPVLLCWKYPEPQIAFWHELDTGFAGRQPIEDPQAFSPSFVS